MTNEQMITEVKSQLEALNSGLAEATSEERLLAIIRPLVEELAGNEDFQRKMRFDASTDPLEGTVYGRLGMSPADIEFAYDLLSAGKRSGLSKYGPSEALTRAFESASPAYYEDTKGGVHKRAMDTAESGYGSSLVGAQYVGELWDGAREQARVMPLMPTFEMQHPTAYLPVGAGLPEMHFVAENTDNNSSNYGTVKTGSNRVTVTAKKFVLHQMWSGEMEEDSIIPFVPFLRAQAMNSLAYYGDSLLINGDTTNAGTGNINLYDADPTDTKHYLALDGLRHAVLVDNTGNATSMAAAAPSWSKIFGIRSLMIDRTYFMDWGHPTNPMDLVYLVNPELADKMVQELDECVTMDKYGAQAANITGQITKIGTNPVVSTMAMPRTETTGFVINSPGTTYGTALLVNRNGYVVGWRRRVKLETERLIATDQWRLVYSLRLGFGRFSPTGAASGIESAAALYYIAL